MHEAAGVAVVAVGVVGGVAVVPEDQITQAPAVADDVFGFGEVGVEEVEDAAASASETPSMGR